MCFRYVEKKFGRVILIWICSFMYQVTRDYFVPTSGSKLYPIEMTIFNCGMAFIPAAVFLLFSIIIVVPNTQNRMRSYSAAFVFVTFYHVLPWLIALLLRDSADLKNQIYAFNAFRIESI